MVGRICQLDEETWTVLLKVMLGAVDLLVGEGISPSEYSLPKQLTPILLRVLIELWLRSGILSIKMWDALKQLFGHWIHRLETIEHWSAAVQGLTHRVIRFVYGGTEGTANVGIRKEAG